MIEPSEPLSEWLPRLQSPALIWLNGHSSGEPDAHDLLAQCESLDQTSLQHVIVVDDGQRLLAPSDARQRRPTLGQVLRALGCPERRRALVQGNVIVALPLLATVMDRLL
jgi:hypothetical protein